MVQVRLQAAERLRQTGCPSRLPVQFEDGFPVAAVRFLAAVRVQAAFAHPAVQALPPPWRAPGSAGLLRQ